MSLEQLISQLSQSAYQPKSAEDIEQEARRRTESQYQQKRLSATQAWEQQDAALSRELGTIGQSFERECAQASAENRQTYAQSDRHALSRGMQRSSYQNATLANIALAGEQAQQDISRRETEAKDGIEKQRTQLSNQLSQQLKQLDLDEETDRLAYADQLYQREYDRQKDANQTAMKLYEYRHQLEQEALEQQRWLAEFNAKYSSSGKKKR